MKKRILSILLTLCMVLCLAPTAAFAEGGSSHTGMVGAGTKEDPYLIGSADELKQFRDRVNKGDTALCAILTCDIVLNDGTFGEDGNYTGGSVSSPTPWTPIGVVYSNRYTGTFDGNGYTIKGMYVKVIASGTGAYAGLFGVAENATIRNLAVDGKVEGEAYTGGIVGFATDSTIENCANLADINTNGTSRYAGGIVGIANNSSISGCYSVGSVTGTAAGGIAGYQPDGSITNSYFLSGKANQAVGVSGSGTQTSVGAKTKAEFANGAVLALLKQGNTNAWGDNGYLAAANMTLPLLKGQKSDDHTHNYEWKHTETQHWQACACGAMNGIIDAHSGSADGFYFSAEKTVTIQDAHSGGKATCTNKAKCEICGAEHGELDADNHTDLRHIDAKAATRTDDGNIEYWCCEDCGKYFADKDGAKEITKADTVIAKLPEEKPTSPKTGDTSNLALWIALLFISGGAVTVTTVVSKKKKHSR